MAAQNTAPLPPALWYILLGLGSMVTLALIVAASGQDAGEALRALLEGALGSRSGLAATASRAVILALYALGIALSFRAGLFNIGAEGQSRMGAAAGTALATGGIGAALATVPLAGIGIVLIAGALAGAAWSLIAGLLKQLRGVSEVIATLMLNFVALLLVQHLLRSPALLRGPDTGLPQSEPFPDALQFPGWGGTELHSGVFLALPAILLAHVYLFHTASGLRLRATGLNPFAARSCGVMTGRLQLFSFGISGAVAGFAGALTALALGGLALQPSHREYGFKAIAVALVADLKPLRILPAALFFAALEVGAKSMEITGVSNYTVHLVEGLVILAVLARNTQFADAPIAAPSGAPPPAPKEAAA